MTKFESTQKYTFFVFVEILILTLGPFCKIAVLSVRSVCGSFNWVDYIEVLWISNELHPYTFALGRTDAFIRWFIEHIAHDTSTIRAEIVPSVISL